MLEVGTVISGQKAYNRAKVWPKGPFFRSGRVPARLQRAPAGPGRTHGRPEEAYSVIVWHTSHLQGPLQVREFLPCQDMKGRAMLLLRYCAPLMNRDGLCCVR